MAQSFMHANDLALEFARGADAAAIAQMSRDHIEAGLGWEYRPERIARYLGDADAVVLTARVRGSLAGFAIMNFGDERAHPVLLAVAPPLRRQGIGARMVAWLVGSARVAGVVSVHVELRAGNHAAARLYRAAGFVQTLRVDGYYRGREAAIRMLLLLRPPVPG